MSIKSEKLKRSYDDSITRAEGFCEALREQVSVLLTQNALLPALPVERRVKKWPSILVKLDRLQEPWESVEQIWDFVGLRLVFLLPEEANLACELLDKNFEVEHRENVADKLLPDQFGYQSLHYTIRLLPAWRDIPTLKLGSNLRTEVQIRTLSQHNWAVASRLFHYNNANSAPASVQRGLFRVAALLEVVDLELHRFHKARAEYRESLSDSDFSGNFNIDILKALLERYLPTDHFIFDDDYIGLFTDLHRVNVYKTSAVVELINKHLEQALAKEKDTIREVLAGNSTFETNDERAAKGVYYSHAGLMQCILNLEFGLDWRKSNL